MTQTKEWHPGTLLELSGYYWKTCTLHAAVKLDIFTLIGKDILTAPEMVRKTGWDSRGLSMLLDALAAMALLNKTPAGYANTQAAADFLSKDSDRYIGYMIQHHHHLADSWIRMDEAVTRSGPIRDRSSVSSEEWREAFLMGMFNNAMAMRRMWRGPWICPGVPGCWIWAAGPAPMPSISAKPTRT